MPRPKQDVGCLVTGACQTRKRGCSSSSSPSSSVLQNSRFKRAILVGRRGGTSTPFPTWRVNARSPCSTAAGVSDGSQFGHSHGAGKDNQVPVSARKLATALWELNELSKPKMMGNLKEVRRGKTGVSRRERTMPKSAYWRSLPPHLSDPSHSTGSEMKMHSQDFTPTSSAMRVRSRLKDLGNSLTAFKQLLKLLDHTRDLHEQHSSTASLFSVLHSVLGQACIQVAQLMEEQRSGCNEVDYLKRWFMEEKAAWKSEVQDRIKSVMQPVVDELKLERELRRRTERLNRKIKMELSETKTALMNVTKALQSERRSSEIIGQICNELVRGVREDKAQVEQMKRESAMAQEELEKEREMLQLADIWREERVQMKLSEAKYQFEEKNADIDKLRNELKSFLPTKMLTDNKLGFMEHRDKQGIVGEGQLKHLSKVFIRTATSADDGMTEEGEVEGGEEADGKDNEVNSTDSDLHSIELNMDNSSTSYKWSYAARSVQANLKVAPVEEKFKERSLGSEKTSWGSIPLEKVMSDNTGWGFGGRDLPHLGVALHDGGPPESKTLPDWQSGKLVPDVER